IMDYPTGTPQRVTDHNFTEAMPVWSPDGTQLAFVTWEGDEGHIYTVDIAGGNPQKLTTQAATYSELAWDEKSDRLIFLMGPAQAYQNAIGPFAFGATDQLAWIPATGGNITSIKPANGRSNPHFIEGNDRIFLFKEGKGLISIRWDGTDEKAHLKVTGVTTFPAHIGHNHCMMVETEREPQKRPSNASMITMAPKGDYALAQINNEIYAITVPIVGGETPQISVAKADKAAFPSWKLTEMGGEWPHWSADGQHVNWSLGNAYFSFDLAEAKRIKNEEATKKEDVKNKPNKKKEKNPKKEEEGYKAKEIRVIVKVNRDIPKGKVLLSGARLITMRGDEIITKGDILIEHNRIKAIGATGSLTVDDDTKILDLQGKTIVPGFVDTHAHMWPNWGLHKNQVWIYAANLAYGVTTTRDPQTATTDVLTYADMVDAGTILGPRVYSTGPGVGFWSYRMTSKEHASKVLKQYSEYYNTKTIKMYLTGNRQHRQWIIEAAKEQGLMPTTEGGLDFKLNMTQLLDGYPGHEHAFPIYPIYDDVIKVVAESKMAYTPTLLVAYGGPWAENYFYAKEDVQGDKKLNYFTPKAELDEKSRRRPGWFMEEEHIFQRHAEFVNALVQAGGIAGVGSHGQLQGLGYHWELWSMQAGGLSEHNALKVATILGATAIGLDQDLGSLEPGKIADLLILEGNPLEDIRHTNTITHVMKNGRLYNGNTLDEEWPRTQKAPIFKWQEGAPSSSLPGIKK
ncbi:MAG: amidohydrolase family protein, partial [Saprospiraceae bacterium]|nr:amidohydrolase family protein [Saprospiraceae bacterium]